MKPSLRDSIAIVLLITVAIALQVWRDRGWQPYHPPSPLMWLHAGPAIRRASLGYDALLADLYWIRTVVYFGRQRLSADDRPNYELLYPLLDLVTTLDLRFTAAYRFGAIFLAEPPPGGPGRPDLAVGLLRRGMDATPERWEYLHGIAFVEYWSHGNYAAAADWLERAARIPNAPIWLKSSAALMRQQAGDRTSARLLWRQLHDSTDDVALRGLARTRIAQFDAMDEIEALNDLVRRFKERAGRMPAGWLDLIEAGLMNVVPVDPAGVAYELDSVTADVRPSPQSPLWPLPGGPYSPAR
jgi:hypothetical protein